MRTAPAANLANAAQKPGPDGVLRVKYIAEYWPFRKLVWRFVCSPFGQVMGSLSGPALQQKRRTEQRCQLQAERQKERQQHLPFSPQQAQ